MWVSWSAAPCVKDTTGIEWRFQGGLWTRSTLLCMDVFNVLGPYVVRCIPRFAWCVVWLMDGCSSVLSHGCFSVRGGSYTSLQRRVPLCSDAKWHYPKDSRCDFVKLWTIPATWEVERSRTRAICWGLERKTEWCKAKWIQGVLQLTK